MGCNTKRRFDIEKKIYNSYIKRRDNEPDFRPFIGGSDVGQGYNCPRHIWYTFRHVQKKTFSGRILRLFERGHREEPEIENDLIRAGIKIVTKNKKGDQFSYQSKNGHYKVNLDGIALIDGVKFIVEMKTMGLKKFQDLEEYGIKDIVPGYYAQMQFQLHVSKTRTGIEKALFIAVNKNTDHLYIAEVKEDKEEQDRILGMTDRIIDGDIPNPLEINENSIPCRWCDYKDLCRNQTYNVVDKNCRSCNHSKPIQAGEWSCNLGKPFGYVCNDWKMHVGI